MQMLAQVKRMLAALPPPDPRQPSSSAEAKEREEKRRHLVAAAGRDRDAHQRRERAAQEALHQPVHARGGLRDLLRRRCGARSRSAAPRNFPELGGRKLYGELTMIVTVDHDGRVLETEVVRDLGQHDAGPPRPGDRARGRRPSAASTTPCAARPTRSWWSRASGSRATRRWKPSSRANERRPLLRDRQPGRAQPLALDPRALCRADRPAHGLRQAPGRRCDGFAADRAALPRARRRAAATSPCPSSSRPPRWPTRSARARGWPAPATRCASMASGCSPTTPTASGWCATSAQRRRRPGRARPAAGRRRRRGGRRAGAAAGRARRGAVVIANRTPAKAQALVDSHAALARAAGAELLACGLDDIAGCVRRRRQRHAPAAWPAAPCRCRAACCARAPWPTT